MELSSIMLFSLILLLSAWVAYFALHSYLADTKVKEYIYETYPGLKAYYRILYNLLAMGLLIPLVLISFLIDDFTFWSSDFSSVLGVIITGLGVISLLVSFSSFNLKEFIGLEQMQQEINEPKLVQKGMYQYVRHPLYFSIILIFFGVFLMIPGIKFLALFIVVFIYLIIGSGLEEKKLEKEFGAEYAKYKKEVKGLIPYLF